MNDGFEQAVEGHMQRWRATSDHEPIPFPFANVMAGEGLDGTLGAAELEAILRVSSWHPEFGDEPTETANDLRGMVSGVVADGERVVLQCVSGLDRRIRQAHINDWAMAWRRPGASRGQHQDWRYGWQEFLSLMPIIRATLGIEEEWIFIAPWVDAAQFEHQFDQAIKAAEQYQRRR